MNELISPTGFLLERKCKNCSKIIQRFQARTNYNSVRFCSIDCKEEWRDYMEFARVYQNVIRQRIRILKIKDKRVRDRSEEKRKYYLFNRDEILKKTKIYKQGSRDYKVKE